MWIESIWLLIFFSLFYPFSVFSMSPPSNAAVITVEVWITMPRSVACPLSQRNATTARASRTWWLSVPTRRWRLPQALRTNMRLPRPPAQGPGPISVPQRRRSAPARLLWRAPPPPLRSPTHTVAPGPRGGGNPETARRGEPFTAKPPDPHVSPQSRIPETPTLIYLTPVKKYGRSYFLYFYFICLIFFCLTSAAMATINGVRTCVNVCDWLAVLWCSYGSHHRNGDCREWLFFSCFKSVQLKSETTWYESWLLFFFFLQFFSPLDLSVGHFECFLIFPYRCFSCRPNHSKNHDASF